MHSGISKWQIRATVNGVAATVNGVAIFKDVCAGFADLPISDIIKHGEFSLPVHPVWMVAKFTAHGFLVRI